MWGVSACIIMGDINLKCASNFLDVVGAFLSTFPSLCLCR